MVLHHFTHCTDEIGADERVLPCERCGMTGVVHDGAQNRAIVRNCFADQDGVVRWPIGSEAADKLVRLYIEEIPLGGQ